jgi:type VI secretion system secreted protein Hcp
MAFDAFLKVDGIPGESTDDKHKDWIEISRFSTAHDQPSSATGSSAGGGTTERADFHDTQVTKLIDKASPKLAEACATGKHIANVVIELCRAGGDKLRYLEIKMEDVVISSYKTEAPIKIDPKGGDTFPIEDIDFNFAKIKWTYTQQKRADGTGGGNVTGGWDLIGNKVHS